MSGRMQLAAVFPRPGECQLIDVDESMFARPEPHQVVIDTVISAVSPGTETVIYAGRHSALQDPNATWPKFPFEPGYSVAGIVRSVGANVADIAPGDRVFAKGPHASVVCVSDEDVTPLADGVTFEQGAFAGLGAIALNGVRIAEVTLGESVAVVGLGVIGLLAGALCAAAGATTILGADLVASRREMAMASRFTGAVDPRHDDVSASLRAAGGSLADVVIDATGVASVFPTVLPLARDRGRVLLLGAPHGRVELDLYTDLQRRNLRILGGHERAHLHAPTASDPWTVQRNRQSVLRLIQSGSLDVDHLVTRKATPDVIPEIYEDLVHRPNDQLAILIDWSR